MLMLVIMIEISFAANIEHRTPNAERQTPNTKHQTPNTKHQTLNIELRTLANSLLRLFRVAGDGQQT
jgi:hypothetical protein